MENIYRQQNEKEFQVLTQEPFTVTIEYSLLTEFNNSMQIDVEQIATICGKMGVSPDMLRKLTIKLVNDPIKTESGRDAGAVFIGNKNTIELSLTTFVNYLQSNLTVLRTTTEQQETDPEFLKQAEEKLREEIQEYIDRTLIHELAHFIRDAKLKEDIFHSLKNKNINKFVRSIMVFTNQRMSLFTPEGINFEENATDTLTEKIMSELYNKNILTLQK